MADSGADIDMMPEAGPSTPILPAKSTPSPFSFNLAAASARFCADIGCTDATAARRAALPDVIINAAYDERPDAIDSADLLSVLSQLVSQPGLTEPIATHFRPVMLPILAHWLETGSTLPVEEWEKRLGVVASMAPLRPDLWR